MGQLEHLLRKEETPADTALNNVSGELGGVKETFRALVSMLNEMQGAIESQNQAINKIEGLVQSNGDKGRKGQERIDSALRAINTDVSTIPRNFPAFPEIPTPISHSEEIQAVNNAIAAIRIPETDFTHIVDMLKMIAVKLDEPMEVDLPEPEKKKWRFEIERETFSDEIKEIRAFEV